MKQKREVTILPFLLHFIPLLVGIGLYYYAGSHADFAEWYALKLYPLWIGTIGRFSSLFPFSLLEWGIYFLILLGIFLVLRDMVRLFRHRHGRRTWFWHWLEKSVLILGLVLLSFMLGCGINYNRKPFSQVAGFTMGKNTVEELEAVSRIMLEGIQATEGLVTRNEDGLFVVDDSLHEKALAAMKNLAGTYSCLSGYYGTPKPVTFSRILSAQNITGIYDPFTAEAQYNDEDIPYNLPMTVCHELSHMKGFMREDEANFIGILACLQSEDAGFRYSGYMLGFIYTTNALAGENIEAWEQLMKELPDSARYDMDMNTLYWKQFEGPVAEAAEKRNDTYLQINHQTDGVKSYGRVVDLLLAYYRK